MGHFYSTGILFATASHDHLKGLNTTHTKRHGPLLGYGPLLGWRVCITCMLQKGKKLLQARSHFLGIFKTIMDILEVQLHALLEFLLLLATCMQL